MIARRQPRSLAGPIGASAVLHAAIILPLVLLHTASTASMPPMYKVELIAAPAGERAAGVVTSAPAPVVPTKAPPKAAIKETKAVKTATKTKVAPKPVVQATPKMAAKNEPLTKDAPKAGGGPTGGKGADVQSIDLKGLDFPYPGYLQNIVRQIALNFSPKGNVGALRAEVFFMIDRNGNVSGFKFLSRSGNYSFDIEAQGAVDAASHNFGKLPAGFTDDVLPIVFSFDPSKLK
ncbi:MAG TPA: TonB C-terminal domain-containing protein [Gemmatimonadaceae bacterium]|nr:TonB C-terminal domain-containing protein [Gemmatimonadaceae bacterium]